MFLQEIIVVFVLLISFLWGIHLNKNLFKSCIRWKLAEYAGWIVSILLLAVTLGLMHSLIMGQLAAGESIDKRTLDANALSTSYVGAIQPSNSGEKATLQTKMVESALGSQVIITQPSSSVIDTSLSVGKVNSQITKAPDDSTKDAISNTMTALSTVIAAVTLLLGIGSAWFMQEVKKMDEAIKRADTMRLGYEKRYCLNNELLAARLSLQNWVEIKTGQSLDRWSTYNRLSMYLEMLMSSDEVTRKHAFGKLVTDLPNEKEMYDNNEEELLEPIRVYVKNCHDMHMTLDKAVVSWCLIFDKKMRDKFTQQNRQYEQNLGAEFV